LSFAGVAQRVLVVDQFALSAEKLNGSETFSVPAFGQDLLVLTESGVLVNVGQVIDVSWEDGSGRNYLVRTRELHNKYPDKDCFYFKLSEGVSGPVMRG